MHDPPAALPAHQTKHLQTLRYPIGNQFADLTQLDDGETNGTALWLGAQCLSLYLADNHNRLPSSFAGIGLRPKAVELGSGIGLTALTLASLGWDVLATDMQNVISTVLSPNISQNITVLPTQAGLIHIRELDWTVPPEYWTWDSDTAIAASGAVMKQSQRIPIPQLLRPPFDLILTSDTIYSPDLAHPLLRSLHTLCTTSIRSHTRSAPAYVCVERRDPTLIDRTLTEARDIWGFAVVRIPHRKVSKAMEKGGVKWDKEDWDGIEIWKLTLDGK